MSQFLALFKLTFLDAIRSKWIILFTLVFLLLAINVPLLLLFAAGYVAPNYLDTYLTYLVTLSYPYLPLLALPIGSTSIVDERESGALQYMLSLSLSREKFLVGRIVGLLAATSLVVFAGYGIDALITFQFDVGKYYPVLLVMIAALGLNACTMGIALLVSTLSKRKVEALGAAIFIWFSLTVLSDFGDLSVVLAAGNVGIFMIPLIMMNPVESYRLLGVLQLNPTYSELGGTGLVAQYYFGNEVTLILTIAMILWIVGVYSACFIVFHSRDVA